MNQLSCVPGSQKGWLDNNPRLILRQQAGEIKARILAAARVDSAHGVWFTSASDGRFGVAADLSWCMQSGSACLQEREQYG